MRYKSTTNLRYILSAATIIALISLSAFAALGTSVMAKSDNGKGQGNGNGNNPGQQMLQEQQQRMQKLKEQFMEHRFISMFGGDNFAYFLSVKAGNSTAAFALRVADEGIPSIYTSLANTSKDGKNVTADWVTGVLRIRGLIEYNDTNADGIYSQGNDTKLQYVNFSSLDWSLTTKKVTLNGNDGWNITLVAKDHGATYIIRTQVYNTGATLPDGTPIAPNEAKVDFIFLNFPWNSTTSRLALLAFFGGQQGAADITHTDSQTEAVMTRNAFAYFTWAGTAIVNGNNVNVVSSSQKEGSGNLVELNYPHGTNITHDPIVGVGTGTVQDIPSYYIPSSTNNNIAPSSPGLYSLAIPAIIVVAFTILALVARKRMVEPRLQI